MDLIGIVTHIISDNGNSAHVNQITQSSMSIIDLMSWRFRGRVKVNNPIFIVRYFDQFP